MKIDADLHEKLDVDGLSVEREHDAFVREKVARGLAQSENRDAMIPAERVLRDLSA